ncbi:MAG: 4Fe-4S dicluster domain-containing protein [Candidatus Njordarchaeota archaeon]
MGLEILIYDIGGCEGCPVSILREYPKIASKATVYSKHLGDVSLDKKYDIAIITGSACINDENVINTLKKIRENAKIVIAYGSCASVGNVTLFCRGGQEPRPEHRTFQPISTVIDIEYAIPGCPPAPMGLVTLINSLTTGKGQLLRVFSAISKVKRLSGFDLMDEVVLSGLCIGCGACIISCPTHALQMIEKRPDLIVEKCIRCGTCCSRCPIFSRILIYRFKPEVKLLEEVKSE